jgi:DNA-binding transcriptional MerR regulator
VLRTLIQRSWTICKADSLDVEIEHLKKTFRQNGYSNQDIKQALHHKKKPQTQQETQTSVAMLPYQQTISNKISRLLDKYNINTVHVPAKKNIHLLTCKDKLGLKVTGINRITCECGKVCV